MNVYKYIPITVSTVFTYNTLKHIITMENTIAEIKIIYSTKYTLYTYTFCTLLLYTKNHL